MRFRWLGDLGLERAQRLRGADAQRAHEPAVVLVGDLAGPVVELQLLERGERAVPLLGKREPPLLELVWLQKTIVSGTRLPQERQGNEQHARNREHRTDDQGGGQIRTTASA